MQGVKVEIVYQLKSNTCLYFEGFSSDLAAPIRVSSTTILDCGDFRVIVPRIPAREIIHVLDIAEIEDVMVSDLLPPCDLVKDIREYRGYVELQDFLELRFISYIDRVTGKPVRCYVALVRPGVLFDGKITVVNACENIRVLEAIVERLESIDAYPLGGFRIIGCGFVELTSAKAIVEYNGVREEVPLKMLMQKVREICRESR